MVKPSKRVTPEQLAKSATEHGKQSALFCWAAEYVQTYPRIRFMFAIPNGGLRDQITASRLRAEGVKRGVPDIFLPIPVFGFGGTYAGLFIEMKRRVAGQTSSDQDNYHEYLRKAGFRVEICTNWESARDVILSYINMESWHK